MTWLILAACGGAGILLGMSWQWRRDKPHIDATKIAAAKELADSWAPMFAADHALENRELRARVRELETENKALRDELDGQGDDDDWGEQDQFDMDEQMMRTGSHQ